MSLNFFKKETKKTDASLNYDSILNNLRSIDDYTSPINIDKFIQSNDIQLRQHQEFYKSSKSEKDLPLSLGKENNYTADDTRDFANSLLDLSKTAASIKTKVSTLKSTVGSSIVENKQTAGDINATIESF